MSSPGRVVVIGGVAAGMSAASQVRRRTPSTRVTVFEQGPHISYGACGMPYALADPEPTMEDLVVLTPEEARDERGIDLHLRHRVTELDLAAGEVTVHDLESGSERREPFDRLVYCTGAEPVLLPLPGFDLEGVLPLRDLEDGMRMAQRLGADLRQAVIIGAGYIGMEMAHTLRERGIGVTVLEKAPQILPGWHQDTVAMVVDELGRHDVEVRTGIAVEGAEGHDGRVGAVTAGGERFEAQLVLVAAGIRPVSRLARQAGLRIGESGAVWVTQHQQTSHEAVWAAGDCAEAYHRILRRNVWIPLGTTANKQGRVAGANAAGLHERFRGIVGTAGFLVFDLEVARTGLGFAQASEEGFEPVQVTIRQRSRAHSYPTGSAPLQVNLVADRPTGLLLGCELTGRDGAALRVNAIAAALAAHMTVADLQSLDLVYAPPFAPVWDPLLVAANQLSKSVGSDA